MSSIAALHKEFMSFPEKDRERAYDTFWDVFFLRLNYDTNKIEGSTLSYEEAKRALFDKLSPAEESERDFYEMRAHGMALKKIRAWAREKDRLLSETDIRTLNKIILVKNYWVDAITPDNKPSRKEIQVGKYKEMPNHVLQSDNTVFRYTEPRDVPQEMEKLLNWYRKEEKKARDIVKLAALFHYKFVRIHPFDDGNGRVARLLMNYILLRAGYAPIYIPAEGKKRYLQVIRQADKGEEKPLCEYAQERMAGTILELIKLAKGEDIRDDRDVDKEIELWKHKKRQEQTEHIRALAEKAFALTKEPGFRKRNWPIKANNERILSLAKSSFRPLFKAMYEKLSEFDEFAISSDHQICAYYPFKNEKLAEIRVRKMLCQLPKFLTELRICMEKENAEVILGLSVEKKITLLHSFAAILDIEFEEKIYNICCYCFKIENLPQMPQGKCIFSKSYSEEITEEEREEIANTIKRDFFELLKEEESK